MDEKGSVARITLENYELQSIQLTVTRESSAN
jgi:hypothetical protein